MSFLLLGCCGKKDNEQQKLEQNGDLEISDREWSLVNGEAGFEMQSAEFLVVEQTEYQQLNDLQPHHPLPPQLQSSPRHSYDSASDTSYSHDQYENTLHDILEDSTFEIDITVDPPQPNRKLGATGFPPDDVAEEPTQQVSKRRSWYQRIKPKGFTSQGSASPKKKAEKSMKSSTSSTDFLKQKFSRFTKRSQSLTPNAKPQTLPLKKDLLQPANGHQHNTSASTINPSSYQRAMPHHKSASTSNM